MGTSRRWTAQELLGLVLDPGSFQSWDGPVDISIHSAGYQAELRAAAEKAGTDEAVLTGRPAQRCAGEGTRLLTLGRKGPGAVAPWPFCLSG